MDQVSIRPRDPIGLELLKNSLAAVADEMAVTVLRTARSSVVKEAMDFSTGLINAEGELIAQGLCLPLHMGSFPPAIDAVRRHFGDDMHAGDVYVLNDPYVAGGSHLPDIYVFQPVFLETQLIGFAAAIAHQVDIGGRVPGGNASDSTEIYQEGLRIPPLKLFDKGHRNETLFDIIRLNVRVPDLVVGDIMAIVAACHRGELGLLELARRHGAQNLETAVDDLLDYTEDLTRAGLQALPDGEWAFEDFLDGDGFDSGPIRIRVKLGKKGGELTADFAGTSPQVKGAINTTSAFVKSCVYACVRSVLDPNIPNNVGFMRPIKVLTGPGSLLDSLAPAPVGARGLTAMRVADVVWGALAGMLPDKVFACGVGADFGVTIAGYHPNGRPFVHLEFLYGNWGGSATRDGLDGISSLVSNYSNTPIEVVEGEQPIRVERYEYRADSAGPGRNRGGLGLVRDYILTDVEDAVLQVRVDRQKFPPYGLYGGESGALAQSILNPGAGDEQRIEGKFLTTLKRGQTFRAALPGGGGWGSPLDRDPAAVLVDVLDEKVSVSAALERYGVVIDRESNSLDTLATTQARTERRKSEHHRNEGA